MLPDRLLNWDVYYCLLGALLQLVISRAKSSFSSISQVGHWSSNMWSPIHWLDLTFKFSQNHQWKFPKIGLPQSSSISTNNCPFKHPPTLGLSVLRNAPTCDPGRTLPTHLAEVEHSRCRFKHPGHPIWPIRPKSGESYPQTQFCFAMKIREYRYTIILCLFFFQLMVIYIHWLVDIFYFPIYWE